jgi:hypothetical protein
MKWLEILGVLGVALIANGSGCSAFATAAAPFSPMRKLTSWYTDRSLIDVEVVATSGSGPDSRFLIPKRILKLRLERAYVVSIGWHEQSDYEYSSLSLSLDGVTGLPSALFTAPPEQVEKRGDRIAQLTHDESVRRTLIVSVDGHSSRKNLEINSEKLSSCLGTQMADGLFHFRDDGSTYCHLGSLVGKTNYIALLSDGVYAQITCTDQDIACNVPFPFDGFAPVVGFHRDRLSDWKRVVVQAFTFLETKKFKQ